MAVFLILAATGSRISALVLLGVDEIILSIVVLALSVWTLLLAMSLYLSFHALRLVMRSKRSHTDPARYVHLVSLWLIEALLVRAPTLWCFARYPLVLAFGCPTRFF